MAAPARAQLSSWALVNDSVGAAVGYSLAYAEALASSYYILNRCGARKTLRAPPASLHACLKTVMVAINLYNQTQFSSHGILGSMVAFWLRSDES